MKIQLFDFSINVMRALLWRHNKAVNLQALLQDKQDAIDELNEDFWTDWFTNVFNLQTANEFGLSVWAIILDIPLTVQDPNVVSISNGNFGFGSFRKNFNNGNFTPFDNETTLSLEDARAVLKLKYYKLITRGTVPECNKIVAEIFPDLDVYVLDNLDMTMTYVFSGFPSASLRAALEKFDLLPRPSAVELNVTYGP